MLITIKSSNLAWTAPDGQLKIWDFTGVYPDTGEQMRGSTRSPKISSAIDQTLDLTTTVSKTGKTYYVQVLREGGGGWNSPQSSYQAPQAPSASRPVQSTSGATERFEKAVERFERSVERFAGRAGNNGDILANDSEVEKVKEFFDGEIVDDL